MFETREDALRHFMGDGDMVGAETGYVYMADCNSDGARAKTIGRAFL